MRLDLQRDRHGRIDGALLNGIHRQLPILGIAPGALAAADAAASAGVLLDSAARFRGHVDQEIALRFVMDDAARVGIEHRRVAARVAVEIEIVVKEELDRSRLVAKVAHDDLAQIKIRIGIDDVVAAQAQAEGLVVAVDVGDEGLAEIRERALPGVALYPGDAVVRPHAESRGGTGVILLPDMREVNVGQAVLRIECDDERAVADEKVTRHQFTTETQRTQRPL